jgi:trehalose 6-phosphate phosphatase
VRELGFKSRPLVLYMGDDVTDYAAFRATNKLAGISIYVGQENVNIPARYFLYSPEEVSSFLEKLADLFASSRSEPPNKYDSDTTL